jgi:hypothetical protein
MHKWAGLGQKVMLNTLAINIYTHLHSGGIICSVFNEPCREAGVPASGDRDFRIPLRTSAFMSKNIYCGQKLSQIRRMKTDTIPFEAT